MDEGFHKQAEAYLIAVDPILGDIIRKIPSVYSPNSKSEPFIHLVDEIISQQLSGKVSQVIFNRFLALFEDNKITAQRILSLSEQTIRDVGISWGKVSYIKDLAMKVENGELEIKHVEQLPDEEVIVSLTKVKGIGRWTAEMFLMFYLERPDIFSYGDYGLRKAMQNIYGLKDLPNKAQSEKISVVWKPYRTVASKYLWKSLDL